MPQLNQVTVPGALLNTVKRNGFLAAVVPPKPRGFGAFGLAPTGQASLIGAGASLVKTRNPVTGKAAQGASLGASVGSVVPVIGTVVGAAIGAVLGAIGGAFMGSKRPESEIWDKYKSMAGQNRGIDYDPQFRNEAFVGLFRLGKNTFPPRAKGGYGANDDARFLDDMAAQIAAAVRGGQLGANDDAKSVFAKVVGPWMAQWGQEGNADWRRWENQIVTDLIDAYLYDQPIVATSYTTSRKANPALSDVVKALPTSQPSPASSSAGAPSAAPVPLPVAAPAPSVSLPAVSPAPNPSAPLPLPVLPGGSAPAASAFTPSGIDVAAIVKPFLDQGASNQQAFAQALQALQNQGVPPTPAVQAAVADAVQSGAGIPVWLKIAGGVAGVAAIGYIIKRRKGRR